MQAGTQTIECQLGKLRPRENRRSRQKRCGTTWARTDPTRFWRFLIPTPLGTSSSPRLYRRLLLTRCFVPVSVMQRQFRMSLQNQSGTSPKGWEVPLDRHQQADGLVEQIESDRCDSYRIPD